MSPPCASGAAQVGSEWRHAGLFSVLVPAFEVVHARCTYTCTCTCTCMRANVGACARMRACMCTCMCVCLRARLMPSLACRAGHGACVADVQFITESGNRDSQAQASCMCDPTYAGEMCQLPVMLADRPGALPTVACLNNCTESGVCVNGTCVCDAGRAGADCSEVSVQQMLDMPCPNSCTNNGVCANGTCACLIGWQGNDCSRLACPSDCSQHGVCQADATCLCDPGWGGAGCMTPLCPNGCTGQGAWVACLWLLLLQCRILRRFMRT